MLNRIIRWEKDCISYEPDPRLAEIIAKEIGAENTKGLATPSIKEEIKKDDTTREAISIELQGVAATKYRAITARANFLSIDRPDIQYAVKEASRSMTSPTEADWPKLERLAKYLVLKPRAGTKYTWQKCLNEVLTYTDGGWAGCKKTRKSTSGGALTYNGCIVKACPRAQNNIALSSVEAELYAEVKAASETLGLMSLLKDLWMKCPARVMGDASAAFGILNRKGLGEVRHIDTIWIWLQEKDVKRQIEFKHIKGNDNPADLFTKSRGADAINKHMEALMVAFEQGRAQKAPTLALRSWHRRDKGTTHLKMTDTTGPNWQDLIERITIDMNSGRAIARDDTEGRSKRLLKRAIDETDSNR